MTVQLTKAEWYAKIKGFVPSWFWETEVVTKDWAEALAKCAEQLQIKLAAHISDTFILQAALDGGQGVLDSHGAERSIPRLANELNTSYAVRVQNLFNQSNAVDLDLLINKVLVAGVARIEDDFSAEPFCSRHYFCNRGTIFLSAPLVNCFSVLVDKQTHAPYAFCNRDYFLSEEDAFCGTDISLASVFALIVQIVNDNKAMGTFYRILEHP